jgi:hypothetical protein
MRVVELDIDDVVNVSVGRIQATAILRQGCAAQQKR